MTLFGSAPRPRVWHIVPMRTSRRRILRGQSPATVVVGLDCATGLQSARILAAHGVPIIGVARDIAHACCRTNVCAEIYCADINGSELIEALATIGRDLAQPAVLLPCTDLSVLQISRWREQLAPWFRFALPQHAVVESFADKARFYDYAQDVGAPVPLTFILRDFTDAQRAARSLHFPCVIKPNVKTVQWKKHSREKAYRVSRREDFLSMYRMCAEWTDILIAQEWIDGSDGDNYTCNCYLDSRSQPLVAFTSRKVRQWPPAVGEGSLSEECRNEIVEHTTIDLFQKAGHHGLGYLEMKRNRQTGQLLIVEPNIGRPTGRSAAAEGAGVALLYTMYCDVLGLQLPGNRQQRYRGSKWVHVRRDLQSAVYQWRRGELGFREWVLSLRGVDSHAIWSWRDPVPFVADAFQVLMRELTASRGGGLARAREVDNVAAASPSRRRGRAVSWIAKLGIG